MKEKILTSAGGGRTYILVLDEGDEALTSIVAFAEKNEISAASVTAIGAFREATVAFFEFEAKTHREIPVAEQSEVLSMIGDIAVDDAGKASLHLHVVLGLSDGSTRGGHFIRGCVRPSAGNSRQSSPQERRKSGYCTDRSVGRSLGVLSQRSSREL